MKIILLAFLVAAPAVDALAGPGAQLVFRGGAVVTGDPGAPPASAIAVQDGRIVYIGDDAGVGAWIDKKTRVVELGENTLLPGFVDHGFRVAETGEAANMVDLAEATNSRELSRIVARTARRITPNAWVVARGWDTAGWLEPRISLSDISTAAGRHPVALFHATDDAVFISAQTMTLAGMDRDYPDPPGGRLERVLTGDLTGLVTDRAADVIRRILPRPGVDEVAAWIRSAADSAAARGITTVCDPAVTPDVLAALEKIAVGKDTLPVRYEGAWSGAWTEIAPLMAMGPRDLAGGRIRIRAVAIPLDGGFNTGGAALSAPYQDNSRNAGVVQYTSDEVTLQIEAAAGIGHSAWILATGNRAVTTAVRGIEGALGDEKVRATFPRVIGADLVDPDDVERLRGTGASVVMMPDRRVRSKRWLERRIGDRSLAAYNWKALAEAQVPLLIGSGSPSAPADPLRDFAIAVTSPKGITREQALTALTGGAVLKPGAPADFTLVSGDLMTLPDGELGSTRAVMTVVDGRVVFERPVRP